MYELIMLTMNLGMGRMRLTLVVVDTVALINFGFRPLQGA